MPEGDTVYRAAHRLGRVLTGRVLARSDFRVPSLATVDLSGGEVTAVRSVGKHLFIDLTGSNEKTLSIHSHLMMDGVWHVYRPGERWRRPGHTARVVLCTGGPEPVEAVGFDLGILELTEHPEQTVAHLGPDLLGDDWDPVVAAANLSADPQRPVGLALLDQRLLAGVGNIYRSELCFLAGAHPSTPIGDVDVDTLVASAHRPLTANALHAVRSTTGDRHRGRKLWVYGRDRRPCRRCGTPIVRGALGEPSSPERVVYVCPRCQAADQTG